MQRVLVNRAARPWSCSSALEGIAVVGGLFSDDESRIITRSSIQVMMTDGRFIFIFLVSRIEKSDLEV